MDPYRQRVPQSEPGPEPVFRAEDPARVARRTRRIKASQYLGALAFADAIAQEPIQIARLMLGLGAG